MSNIIKFLSNNLKIEVKSHIPAKALSFREFLQLRKFSWREREFCHDYIQWLFPLPEPSAFNQNSPLLTLEDRRVICGNFYIKYNLHDAFQQMLALYGFKCMNKHGGKIFPPTKEYCTLKLLRKPDDHNYTPFWLTPRNHNLLRITRILRCLSLCGLQDVSDNFLQALEKMKDRHPEVITDLTWNYWTVANQGQIYIP